MSSRKVCFKYNNKPIHWGGHSKLRPLDIDEFFKITPKFDEKEAIVTGNKGEEKNIAKKTTDDADKNAEETEIIHKYKEKGVTIEDERKTLEYEETFNLDSENIVIKSQQIWRSIYEFIHDNYFKVVKFFPT